MSSLPAPTTSMSTAYVATAQAWAASQKTSRPLQRRSAEPKPSSWRPPVTVFVKMEFGISFGEGSPNKPHKVALGYPAANSTRTPRFLLAAGHADRRAASEDARSKKHRHGQIPRAIAPAHTISIQRKPFQQPQSDIHPHDSASQVPTTRPRPRRSSSLNVLAGSRVNLSYPEQAPHPERTVEPRRPPARSTLSQQDIVRKPLPETPSRFRLGEQGMPWDSPHIPFTIANANSLGHTSVPHSALAAPSDWQQQHAEEYQQRSYSSPTTPLESPIISPQSSSASTRKGNGHNQISSWGVVSADGVSPNMRSDSSRSPLRGKNIINPPPLQAAPPNTPLPPVPRSPKSQVTAIREPVVEVPILEYGADYEETEDEAIKRELQEAKLARRSTTDPRRARELGELNAAMLGFEALDDRFYEPPGTWDAFSDINGSVMPRGTRSLGWAVRVETEEERADAEQRARREARRQARRKAKGKEPMRNELRGIGNASGSAYMRDSRPTTSGTDTAREKEATEGRASRYFTPDDVGRQGQGGVWQEYSPEDWENGDGENSIWRGIERRRSWTSGEALEWQGEYWSAVTYR